MTLPVCVGEHEGSLIQFEKNIYTLQTPAAFAPGQPLRIRVRGHGETEEFEIEARAIGSKRTDDGQFEVRARAINLRRTHRETISKALAG